MNARQNAGRGRFPLFPRPGFLGVFLLLFAALALAAGAARQETAMLLAGAVFLAALAWCFLAVFLSALPQRRRARALEARLSSRNVAAGGTGEIELLREGESAARRGPGRLRAPAALVRYCLRLRTRDGRNILCYFDPDETAGASFPVEKRGAYYTGSDLLVIRDAAGFFSLSFKLPRGDAPRLLALPAAVPERLRVTLHSGGTERRAEQSKRRGGDLTDHRPYVPGDDPRRINWKLYSHAGELFVRQEETEPPPHMRLFILVDTEVDSTLYSAAAAPDAVDFLCENALAAGLDFSQAGLEVHIGFTGGALAGAGEGAAGQTSLAESLAYPWAQQLGGGGELPRVPSDRGVLLLCLPRQGGGGGAEAGASALDVFLQTRPSDQHTDIIFLYEKVDCLAAQKTIEKQAARAAAAAACAALYSRLPRVHASYAEGLC
ncbi:MAG: DUF58 domain-containing protein [Treponema sp.]|jgi:uncharacterized protein (DUF58 family)|nr:DUF58 domain-containing protein [Treponema sp.]